MCGLRNSAAQSRLSQFLLVLSIFLYCSVTDAISQELNRGFKATPDSSITSFQALLSDTTGNFSLGFLRVKQNQLALTILHVLSSQQLWIANPSTLPPWSDRTQLLFNGSLIISDTDGRVFWSTGTDGDRVLLLNSSNLQVQTLSDAPTVLWQSFNFPTDTLVQNQNFTSTMTLISSNGLYSMRLGVDFIGLYAAFNQGSKQIYYKHKALEAKAHVVEGGGPIRIRVNSDGYLGMYQNGSIPVDVQAFNSFQRPINGFLRVGLESDGNLKGYYWDGSNWILDYQAITDQCELPSPCGSYGLCISGSKCSCLDNRTEFNSGKCFPSVSGDLCGAGIASNNYWILRRKGIDLPFKELMGYKTGLSMEQCESLCKSNCSCWGSIYNNASGFCYFVDYPIQTFVGVADESKIGYFKVRKNPGRTKVKVGIGVGIGILIGIIGILIGIIGFVRHRIWRRGKRREGVTRFFEEDDGAVMPGPYKDLGSASFKSIEMNNRF